MSDDAQKYSVENGWLVEHVGHHTCGTGEQGYYGAHEPGCGTEPIARIEDLLRTDKTQTEEVLENGNTRRTVFIPATWETQEFTPAGDRVTRRRSDGSSSMWTRTDTTRTEKHTQPDGSWESYEYDEYGSVTAHENSNGVTPLIAP